MRRFLNTFSYLFHPLFMSIGGALLYFFITPKYVPTSFLYAKLFALIILTVIVPILFFLLLQNLKFVQSIFLSNVRERRIPLLIHVVISLLIVKFVVNGYEFPELHYFFLGVIISSTLALVSAYLRFKLSLHMIAISSVITFVIGLSVHYNHNLLLVLGILFFIAGGVASARMQARAHTGVELVIGTVVGIVSQLIILPFWL